MVAGTLDRVDKQRNRVVVLISWIYSYVFFRRGSRLITRVTLPPEPRA